MVERSSPGTANAPPLARGIVLPLALALAAACSDPRFHRRPADAVFSVGVADGAAGPPQASGPLALRFAEGEPGPSTVVAVRVDRAPTLDGEDGEWAKLPSSLVPLTGAAARVGLDEASFYCRYRSRLALAIDPYTLAPGCPDPCDPAHPPATRAEASAGCVVPFPRFDHGVAAVTVRAAYDDRHLYLLLQWPDPTEDRAVRPWRYDATATSAWTAGVEDEDRALVSFDAGPAPSAHAGLGCAAACHLAGPVAAPAPGTPADLVPPAYLAQFTMHTAADGERVDAWEWRAGGTDPLGVSDDLFWSARRSQGDCPAAGCTEECLLVPPGPACGSAPPALENAQDGAPGYLAAGASGQGDPDLAPPLLFVAGQGLPGWDPTFAAVRPAGAFPAPAGGLGALPGIVLQRPGLHRDDVAAAGRWREGVWTVELTRPLVTGDAGDAQFPLR